MTTNRKLRDQLSSCMEENRRKRKEIEHLNEVITWLEIKNTRQFYLNVFYTLIIMALVYWELSK